MEASINQEGGPQGSPVLGGFKKSKHSITVRLFGEGDLLGRRVEVFNRPAWALEKLMRAGPDGVTTKELPPGIRWSHYVWLLRKQGFVIETTRESHGGTFEGEHGVYRLKSRVVLEDGGLAEQVAA